MPKLKLQYFGHLMWRTDSLKKTLMLGKIEGGSRNGWQSVRWLDGITDLMHMSLSRLQKLVMDREALACCSPWRRKELDTTEQLNWTKDWVLLSPCPPSASLKTAILHLYTNLAIGSPTPTPNCHQPQMLVSMYLCKLGSVERRGRHSPL